MIFKYKNISVVTIVFRWKVATTIIIVSYYKGKAFNNSIVH